MSAKSENGPETFATVGVGAPTLDGIGMITLEDGDVLIYDEDDEDAWIQSDDFIDLEFMM